MTQRFEHAALRAHRSGTNAAVLFADLDDFKLVNDTYGHETGDRLLRAVAERLSGLVRRSDTVARISGDEFAFLCEDLASAADCISVAARIKQAFSSPFDLGGTEIRITASVGMAYAGPGQHISEQLIIDADQAMYQARRRSSSSHHILDLRSAEPTPE